MTIANTLSIIPLLFCFKHNFRLFFEKGEEYYLEMSFRSSAELMTFGFYIDSVSQTFEGIKLSYVGFTSTLVYCAQQKSIFNSSDR